MLSYLFSCILLNLSAFLISFLPIGGSTPKHNFLFSFYILFYFGVLPNLYLIFCPYISRTLSRIVTILGYFGVLLHRLFLGIIILITFEYYQAILLSYLFSCILLNLSAFSISFLPISGSIQKHNFLFYFYIILPLDTTKFIS